MKIKNIDNVEGFFEAINRCKGTAELVTSEGDRINLKSKLSQYVSLVHVFSDTTIEEVEIIAYNHDDLHIIIDFLE